MFLIIFVLEDTSAGRISLEKFLQLLLLLF
jgi:hypothetical protein